MLTLHLIHFLADKNECIYILGNDYLKGKNLHGKKISRVSRISLEFTKLILAKNLIFCNSRNSIFLKKNGFWFAKLSSCKKNLFFLMLDFNGKGTPFPLLSFTLDYNGKFRKVCVLKMLLVFYISSLTKKIRIRDQIEIKVPIFH